MGVGGGASRPEPKPRMGERRRRVSRVFTRCENPNVPAAHPHTPQAPSHCPITIGGPNPQQEGRTLTVVRGGRTDNEVLDRNRDP